MKILNLKNHVWNHSYLLILSVFFVLSCSSEAQQNADDNTPETTIHEAAFMGNVDEIKKHIAVKSDLDEKDAYGSAPLTIAALFGKPEVARLLIDAGADVNIKSGDGSTPMHSAAFFCRKEIVEMLLAANADLTVRNNYGSTALESVKAPFEAVKPVYDQMAKDLGPLGLRLDYDQIRETRPVIAGMIEARITAN